MRGVGDDNALTVTHASHAISLAVNKEKVKEKLKHGQVPLLSDAEVC